MAFTLPTFSLNDPAKEQRLLDAFKPTPTSTNAEAAEEYRKWLKSALIGEVIRREHIRRIQQAAEATPPADDLLEAT